MFTDRMEHGFSPIVMQAGTVRRQANGLVVKWVATTVPGAIAGVCQAVEQSGLRVISVRAT